jgi:hypothetical protein
VRSGSNTQGPGRLAGRVAYVSLHPFTIADSALGLSQLVLYPPSQPLEGHFEPADNYKAHVVSFNGDVENGHEK